MTQTNQIAEGHSPQGARAGDHGGFVNRYPGPFSRFWKADSCPDILAWSVSIDAAVNLEAIK